MNKTKIDWATASWNPVTGCFHGCPYCYARDMANRFAPRFLPKLDDMSGASKYDWNGDMDCMLEITEPYYSNSGQYYAYPYNFYPTFHRYRLEEPARTRKPQNVFVSSMGDIFGEWVPEEWILETLKACAAAPWHNYLFLTKNPKRMHQWNHGWKVAEAISALKNGWFGFSVTSQDDLSRIALDARSIPSSNTFISIEPIHSYIDLSRIEPEGRDAHLNFLNGCQYWLFGGDENGKKVKWVIIGAETGRHKGKIIPEKRWLSDLVTLCQAYKVPVFMKISLQAVWGGPLIQEYPEQLMKNVCSGRSVSNG